MKNQRTKRIAWSLLIVLSLFVSSASAAACNCSHQEKAEADASSCHQHSAEGHSDEMRMLAETSAATFNANSTCVCMQSAPRVFAKSEIVKIEKQAAAISPHVAVSVELSATFPKIETFNFIKPLYLSDSFYKLKSPRAPPRS